MGMYMLSFHSSMEELTISHFFSWLNWPLVILRWLVHFLLGLQFCEQRDSFGIWFGVWEFRIIKVALADAIGG